MKATASGIAKSASKEIETANAMRPATAIKTVAGIVKAVRAMNRGECRIFSMSGAGSFFLS